MTGPTSADSMTPTNSESRTKHLLIAVTNPSPTPNKSVPLPDISIRAAQPNDLDLVEAFIQEFVTARRILPRTTDELTQLLTTGFIAEIQGKIVGFAALEIYSRKLGEIRSLCVSPETQGRGVGRKLTEACVELARHRTVFEVMVVTSSDEFFRSCGFDFTLPGEKKALFLQTRDTP